ncbi:MAG: diguanylate cyclase [Anaerolineaceae bacterium]|nr:diguanylate cyclase [Anaerolineaceae bacterium]
MKDDLTSFNTGLQPDELGHILDQINEGVAVADAQGFLLYANRTGKKIIQNYLNPLNLLIGKSGETTRFKTSSNQWLQKHFETIQFKGKNVNLITFKDITEQNQSQQFIHNQQEILSSIDSHDSFENIHIQIFNLAIGLFPFQAGFLIKFEPHNGPGSVLKTINLTHETIEHWRQDPNHKLDNYFKSDHPVYRHFSELELINSEEEMYQAAAIVPIQLADDSKLVFFLVSKSQDKVPQHTRTMLDSCILLTQKAAFVIKTKIALQNSNTDIKNLLESLEELIFILNQEGLILYTNNSVNAKTGYTVDELAGHPLSNWIASENQEEEAKKLDQILSGEINQTELTLVAEDGLRIPVELITKTGTWNLKSAVFMICHDISSHRQTENELRRLNDQLNHVLFSVSDFLWSGEAINPKNIDVNFASPVFERITGFPAEQLINNQIKWIQIVHPDDRHDVQHAFQKRFDELSSDEIEYRVIHADGQIYWVRDSLTIRRISRHRFRLDGVITDITARKRMEESLQQSYESLTDYVKQLRLQTSEATIINEMGDLLQSCARVEDTYRILKQFIVELFPGMSGALYMLESNLDLLESVIFWGMSPPKEMVLDLADCWALRRSTIQIYSYEDTQIPCSHVETQDQAPYTCIPLIAQSKMLGLLHLRGQTEKNFRDYTQLIVMITERLSMAITNLRLGERLKSQSIRDQLTGLFNRRYMEEMMSREIRRSVRYQRPVGILMLDIDNFKNFNDSYGHAAGDIVLHALGNYLQENMRGEDIVCRYGGEEFTIILAEASLEDTVQRAETLRKGIKMIRVKHAGKDLGDIRVSIGVASFPIHGETPEALMLAADTALYQAKRQGRDCVIIADQDNDSIPHV